MFMYNKDDDTLYKRSSNNTMTPVLSELKALYDFTKTPSMSHAHYMASDGQTHMYLNPLFK